MWKYSANLSQMLKGCWVSDMTGCCGDCIHNAMCEIDGYISECEHFKNKADFVEVCRCKDCKKFIEYSDNYKYKVEGADGDCHIRLMYSADNQFCAVKCTDFCSYGERKENE